LGSGDTGLPVNVSKYPDKTITVDGTFGAAVTLEGTNDERGDPKHSDHVNAPWVPCTDTLDTGAFSKTANAGETILQNYKWMRPVKAVAAGTVVITLTCNRGK